MCDWNLKSWSDLADMTTICQGISNLWTFIKKVCNLNNKTNQIDSTNNTELLLIDAKYAPDIRVDSYWKSGDKLRTFSISNNGENLQIVEMKNGKDGSIIDVEGMATWFPLNFDKGESIRIPVIHELKSLPSNFQFDIVVKNKLNQTYICTIKATGGKVLVCSPIKQNI